MLDESQSTYTFGSPTKVPGSTDSTDDIVRRGRRERAAPAPVDSSRSEAEVGAGGSVARGSTNGVTSMPAGLPAPTADADERARAPVRPRALQAVLGRVGAGGGTGVCGTAQVAPCRCLP